MLGFGFGTPHRRGMTGGRVQVDPALVAPYKNGLIRGYTPSQLITRAGKDRALTQLVIRTPAGVKRFRAVFWMKCLSNGATGEVTTATGGTFRFACERLGTVNTQVNATFDGAPSYTAVAGERVVTDWIDGEMFGGAAGSSLPSNTFFAMKTELVMTTGAAFPAGCLGGGSAAAGGVTGTRIDQCFYATAAEGADQILSTGAYVTSGMSQSTGVCPAYYEVEWASGVTRPRSQCWSGDSIADNSFPGSFNYFGAGGGTFNERAFANSGRPYIKMAQGSRRLNQYFLGGNEMQRDILAHTDDLYVQIGTNDLAAGVSPVALYAQEEAFIYDARVRGVTGAYRETIIPRTTTTDGGATTINQSAGSFGATRVAHRALVTAGLGGATGYDALVDVAADLQDPTDPDKWISNGTPNYYAAVNDSPSLIHPTANGHALPVSRLTNFINSH